MLHHFCFVDWCVAQGVPEVDSGVRLCCSCAKTRFNIPLVKPVEGPDLVEGPPPTAQAAETTTVPADASGVEPEAAIDVLPVVMVDVVDAEGEKGRSDVKQTADDPLQSCPACAARVLASMLSSHMELCRSGRCTARGVGEVGVGAGADGISVVNLRLTVLPGKMVEAKLGVSVLPTQKPHAVAGTRCSWKGRACIVWYSLAGHLSLLFDDMLSEWQTVTCEEFATVAVALPKEAIANGIDSIDHVLLEKARDPRTDRTVRLPAGFLNAPVISENGWQAYLSYKPAPLVGSYATPPVDFPLVPGLKVLCTHPFVSTPKGANAAPLVAEEKVEGVFCGILIGDEYNSTKGKNEQRRWALATVSGVECLMPLSSIGQAAGYALELSREQCTSACERAARGRKPGTLQTMYQSAKHRRGMLHHHLEDGGEGEKTPGLRLGLRTRRATAAPSPAAAELPATALILPPTVEPAAANSGIPLELHGWGETKLKKQTLVALQLALSENSLSASASELRSKTALIKLLLKRLAVAAHSLTLHSPTMCIPPTSHNF